MTARLVKRRGELDLSDWSIESVDTLVERLHGVITERSHDLAREIFDAAVEHDATLNFAIARSVDSDDDPLTLTLILWDIATNTEPYKADTSLEYGFNLRDALGDDLDQCRQDGSSSEQLKSISAALKRFATEIDEAVAAAP